MRNRSQFIPVIICLFIGTCFFNLQAQVVKQEENSSNGETIHNERCYTHILHERLMAEDAEYRKNIEKNEAFIEEYTRNAGNEIRSSEDVRIIPVVVHVIHNNGAENISDAKIQSEIDVLNKEYRNWHSDKTDGVDMSINFCLATKDESGNPSTGIKRVQSASLTNHDPPTEESQLKNLSRWNTTKYLNIWIVKSITNNILGYSTFPGGSVNKDGIVIRYDCFGTIAPVWALYSKGRTAVHEIGHWLSLYHTFQDGCAGTTSSNCSVAGDKVCDTPPTADQNGNFGCPPPQNTCTETPTDKNDQTNNYMDYVDDKCMNKFTAGQKTRVDAILSSTRKPIWQTTNLQSTGCEGFTAIPEPQINAFIQEFEIFPNPSTGNTIVKYTLFKTSNIRVTVHDILGKEIAVLEESKKKAGSYTADWRSTLPDLTPASVYFVKLNADGNVITKKLILGSQ